MYRKGNVKNINISNLSSKEYRGAGQWAREGRAKSRFKENTGLGERFFIDQGKPWEYLNTSSKELVKKDKRYYKNTTLKEKALLKF